MGCIGQAAWNKGKNMKRIGGVAWVAWNKGKVGLCPTCHLRPKKKNGHCRECTTAYMRTWRERNPEAVREYRKEYSELHPGYRAPKYKSPAGRLMNRLTSQRTRARRHGLQFEKITPADWAALLDYFGYRCGYCLGPGPLQQDHIIPITKGGGTILDNIVPACERCNKKKGNRSLLHFLEIR